MIWRVPKMRPLSWFQERYGEAQAQAHSDSEGEHRRQWKSEVERPPGGPISTHVYYWADRYY